MGDEQGSEQKFSDVVGEGRGAGRPDPGPAPVATSSGDDAAALRAALARLAPDAFAEGRLNVDKLRLLLGEDIEQSDERYRFTWLGQADAAKLAVAPSDATLRPQRDRSEDWDAAVNAFVEGDNLQVLKLMSKAYFAAAKLIYIDPPYNLGKDRIYRDSYVDPLGGYLRRTGQTNGDGELTVANLETSGRYHSAWMSLVYPRLHLARRLLRQDGAIAVAIDDTEVHHLRMLMDSVFGPENFIATLVWEGGRKNDATFVSVGHDYTLIYAKDQSYLRENKVRWRVPKEGIDEIFDKERKLKAKHGDDYAAMSAELREWYAQLKTDQPDSPVLKHTHYKHIDRRGVYFGGDIAWPGPGGPEYEVLHPVTKKPVKLPQNGWRYPNKEDLQKLIDDDWVHFGPDETTVPTMKRYLHEVDAEVMTSVFYRDRRGGSKSLTRLVGEDIFDNPKDPDILRELVLATTRDTDLVIDFFAGSSSSAEAVMRANAEDGGKRRWVMVQLPEKPERKAPVETISEGSLIRIKASTEELKVPAETAGYRVFALDKSVLREWRVPETVTDGKSYIEAQTALSSEALGELDEEAAVWEVAIREGYALTSAVEKAEDGGYTLWTVSAASTGLPDAAPEPLFLCLAEKVDEDLKQRFPAVQGGTFVVRESALNDSVAANMSMGCRLKTV